MAKPVFVWLHMLDVAHVHSTVQLFPRMPFDSLSQWLGLLLCHCRQKGFLMAQATSLVRIAAHALLGLLPMVWVVQCRQPVKMAAWMHGCARGCLAIMHGETYVSYAATVAAMVVVCFRFTQYVFCVTASPFSCVSAASACSNTDSWFGESTTL